MHRAIFVTLHVWIQAIFLINCVLLTVNRNVTEGNPYIHGYVIKPEVAVWVHIILLSIAGFVPSLTGLYLTFEKRKSGNPAWCIHNCSTVAGIVCTACLFTTELVSSLGKTATVNCQNDSSSGQCQCGTPAKQFIAAVCDMYSVRILYCCLVGLNLLSDVISLLLSDKIYGVEDTRRLVRVAPMSSRLGDQ